MARKNAVSLSAFANNILTNFTHNDEEFARMMAKKHHREFYYWQGEATRLKDLKEVED